MSRECRQMIGLALMIIGFLVFEGVMVIVSIETGTIAGIIAASFAALLVGLFMYF